MFAAKNKIVGFIKLFRWAFAQNTTPMAFLVLFSFISGTLEGVGISSIIPIFSLIGGDGSGTENFVTKAVRAFFSYLHLPFTLKFLLVFITLIFLLKAATSFLVNYINVYITANFERKTRRELFSLTFAATWPYLSKQKLGFLEQVLTTDTSNSSNLLLHLGSIIPIVVSILVYSILAVNVSWVVAVLTLFVGAVIFLIFKPIFYKNRKYSEEMSATNKESSHFVNESILGLKTIKATHVEDKVINKANAYFERMKDLFIKIILIRGTINVSLQPIGLVYILAIFAFFYKFLEFNLAYFAILVFAINRVFGQIQSLQGLLHYITSEEPYLAAINKYQSDVIKNKERDAGTAGFKFEKELSLQDVSFAYREGKTLSDVSFHIAKGEMVGLIGPSGSGKTTIVDLLLRLYYPQAGKITLDGIDISEVNLDEWRNNIGYVSQDMFLMNDTVENNIKFYNEGLTHEEIVEAARQADIYDFIQTLPQRFDTSVGERGTSLSGGQRQRIVLARILARKPKVLILDEATSALDNESELQIQKVIEGLRGKLTVLAIAHRLSTVMDCDRLLVLENGKIVEQGAPHELLKNKDSYFYKVYNIRELTV